ncbi:polyketide synthase, partial [bacterium]|nr:polyketide synthase [bacterium]
MNTFCSNSNGKQEPIAIVGIGCRFPGGVDSPASYWSFLEKAGDGITDIPNDRWDRDTYYDTNKDQKGKIYTHRGGFLQHIDQFDPQFFGISPREAAYMDPQQRLLLETTYEALTDGGFPLDQLAGTNVGVYIGLFTHDYENIHMGVSEYALYGPHSATGMSATISANRLSYIFNFTGPSMIIDTACSSSLVAIHLACNSLRRNEIPLAVAGGVNAVIKPEMTMSLCAAAMLSPDGYCKTYDAKANGYARAEGAGIVVLKKLSSAIADHDRIHALILGSAVNQDGHNEGISVPNQVSQETLIREALDDAAIRPHQVSYVEAHGTGTAVGDPIEANALGSVFAKDRPNGDPCIVGSVKSNFGHTESAAGAAGLIKVALMMNHKKIPRNLHFENPNPAIRFDTLKLRVPTTLEPWTQNNGQPRIAGVNSFGFGGTNAHLVVCEYDKENANTQDVSQGKPYYFLPLTAASPEALQEVLQNQIAYLCSGKGEKENLYNIGYTQSLRKSHHQYRVSIIAQSR